MSSNPLQSDAASEEINRTPVARTIAGFIDGLDETLTDEVIFEFPLTRDGAICEFNEFPAAKVKFTVKLSKDKKHDGKPHDGKPKTKEATERDKAGSKGSGSKAAGAGKGKSGFRKDPGE